MSGGQGEALWTAYDVAMLDLDGVVYIGGEPVPGAPDHLRVARAAGMRLAFVTNNASRTPDTVADHLTRLDVPADAADVVTSAQAAARVLADRLPAGSRVATVGARGLEQALLDRDLQPVPVDDADAAALVTGYGPDVAWHVVMRAAVRIRDGLWWVASNTDATIPTAFGTAPGHGVMVDMLRRFSGVQPDVGGKPARPLLDETVRRVDARRPLMVGDRLDTDIVGGRNAEVDTLLVMTGVTGLAELVAADPGERPTYVAADLAGLGEPCTPAVPADDGAAAAGGWTARVAGHRLAVEGSGSASDWWRAVAGAAWEHHDRTGHPVATDGLEPPPAEPPPAAG